MSTCNCAKKYAPIIQKHTNNSNDPIQPPLHTRIIAMRLHRQEIESDQSMQNMFQKEASNLFTIDEIIQSMTTIDHPEEKARRAIDEVEKLQYKIRHKNKFNSPQDEDDSKDTEEEEEEAEDDDDTENGNVIQLTDLPSDIVLNIAMFQSHKDYASMSATSRLMHTMVHLPCKLATTLNLAHITPSRIWGVGVEYYPKITKLVASFGVWAGYRRMDNDKFWSKMKSLKLVDCWASTLRCTPHDIFKKWQNTPKPNLESVYLVQDALRHVPHQLFYNFWEPLVNVQSIRFGGNAPHPLLQNTTDAFSTSMPNFPNLKEFQISLIDYHGYTNGLAWLRHIHRTVESLYLSVRLRTAYTADTMKRDINVNFPKLKYLHWTGKSARYESGILMGIVERAPKLERIMVEISPSWTWPFIAEMLIYLITRRDMKEITLCTSFTKIPTKLVPAIIYAFDEIDQPIIKPKFKFVIDHFWLDGQLVEDKTASDMSDILASMETHKHVWSHCVEFEYSNSSLGKKESTTKDDKGTLWNMAQDEDLFAEFNVSWGLRDDPSMRRGNCCGRKHDWAVDPCKQCIHEHAYNTIRYFGPSKK